MTGEGGSLDGAKTALNELTNTLGSNTTKAAFEAIVGWVVSLTNMVIKATANIVAFMNTADKLGALTGTDVFGKMKSEAQDAGAEVKRLGDQLERHQEALEAGSIQCNSAALGHQYTQAGRCGNEAGSGSI